VVNLKHARRNALLPVITLASFTVMGLLSGAVITETIFAYPGIGSWGAQAATLFDVPGIMGFAILTAVVTVVVNLATDILYALVDPRVRYD
jgi:peptide/nickel transport system permease protein